MADFDVQKNIDEMAEELEKTFSDERIISSSDGIPNEADLLARGISIGNNMNISSPAVNRVVNENVQNPNVTTNLYEGLIPSNEVSKNVDVVKEDVVVTEANSSYTGTGKSFTGTIDTEKLKEGYVNTEKKAPKSEKTDSDAMKMAKEEAIHTKQKVSPDEFLKNLKVDLNNIDVVDENPLNKFKNFNFVMNRKSKTQVVALQSGYVAYVEGYNYDDINGLVNSSLDDYGNQLLLCQTVFNSINNSSIGRPSFEKWCKLTSYYDLDSFLYGNYLETFPGNTTFTVKCGTCGKEVEVAVNNDTLISARDPHTQEFMDEILKYENDSTETVKKAILSTTRKIFLPDSKVIITFKLPTIQKHLDLLASINLKAKQANQHVLTFLLFIEEMYMLDLEASLNAGSPKYNRITDNSERTNIIKHFTYNDAKLLSDSINDLINKYQLSFRIKSFTCNACGNQTGDVPVDMESILFFRMSQ